MGIYDRPGNYWFADGYDHLEETVQQFRGSFDRDGQAVRGGFNVASVLSPLWSDRQACQKGENPLECEFRMWRPSIAIISMETWFPGRTAETYEDYLRQIVEFTLAHKTVPILATKADNTEGNHTINLAVARVAYEYDLPLWNFWLAVQPLEGHGLDWARDKDGFHITVEAWDRRSFTALQAIDAVWKMLNSPIAAFPTDSESDQVEAAPQPTFTPTPIETTPPTLHPTPLPVTPEAIITPVPDLLRTADGTGSWQDNVHIVLNLGERVGGEQTFSGLYLVTVKEEGISLEAISGTGTRLEGILPAEEDAVLVNKEDSLYRAPLDGSAAAHVSTDTDRDWEAWKSGPMFSPDQTFSVNIQTNTENGAQLYLKHLEKDRNVLLREIPGYYEYLRWSPDGEWLLAIETFQSSYSGKILGRKLWVFNPPSLTSTLLSMGELPYTHAAWSPDGSLIAFLGIEEVEGEQSLRVKIMEVQRRRVRLDDSSSLPWGKGFVYLDRVGWLP